jgi:hypothetical protein
MYRKQKITSTPHVDVEELKKQLTREVLGDLRPILEAQGIQFTDIGGVMSNEERLCLYSCEWTTTGEHQVLASRLVEGHEQPLPSIEPDMIDNLLQPTACSLILLVGGSFWMKVRRVLVYSCQTMLDNIEIDVSSYAIIKVDMVHENLKNLKLEVPPDDTMLTMRDVVTRRV